ncbi:Hsp70 family protein [Mycobacterium dioxanotrophicus]|uniref:Hsp70 family protein n=1 Tax=Mycobacterium dioxanotrophicus TaxID=482462 RepID=UPI001E29754A|nr:Hsp70 family protein [Mycobacterium dioxanotrophicus]
MRRSVLTLFRDRMPEVGVLDGDGLVISGFVERVGDPIPLLAADGSAHRGEQLLAAAVESMTRAASPAQRPERTVVAVPAYWAPAAFDAARAAMPGVRVVSDAVAALTAMQAHPGLPARGIVALADFGATGTSLTLADAGARFAPIGQTVRYDDFSGDLVDQELLRHVLSSLDADASGTAAVAALSRLREESRAAKERLSYEAATGLPGPMPGSTLRLTRAELEAVIDAPLGGVVEALHDLLRRNGVHPAQLAALVTVGGTARIPLVTQRLSEAFRMSVTTVAQAQVVTAIGAGLLARRGEAETAATRAVTAAPFVAASTTGTVAASSLAPAALAWSVSDPAAEVMDYIPESVSEDSARPAFVFAEAPREPSAAARTPWYRGILVCAAALLTVVGTAGLLLSAHADKMDATPANGPAAPGLAPAEAPLAQVGAAPPTRTVVVQDPAVPAPAPRRRRRPRRIRSSASRWRRLRRRRPLRPRLCPRPRTRLRLTFPLRSRCRRPPSCRPSRSCPSRRCRCRSYRYRSYPCRSCRSRRSRRPRRRRTRLRRNRPSPQRPSRRTRTPRRPRRPSRRTLRRRSPRLRRAHRRSRRIRRSRRRLRCLRRNRC